MKKLILFLLLIPFAAKSQCGITHPSATLNLDSTICFRINAGNATLTQFTFNFNPTWRGNFVNNPYEFGGGGDQGIQIDQVCGMTMTATVNAYYFDIHDCIGCSPAQLDSLRFPKCTEMLTYQTGPCPTQTIFYGGRGYQKPKKK